MCEERKYSARGARLKLLRDVAYLSHTHTIFITTITTILLLLLPLHYYSAATKGSLEDECELDEELNSACEQYEEQKTQLAAALQELQSDPKLAQMKELAASMKNIKLTVQQKTAAPPSPAVTAALQAAMDAEQEFGKGSPEAVVAWSELEEVASSGLENSMGARFDEECLVESAQAACEALDELDRVVLGSNKD